MSKDCTCPRCVNACAGGAPGWFAPGEAEKVAEFLGVPFPELKKRLIKDSCSNWNVSDAPFVWSPRKDTDPTDDREHRLSFHQRMNGRCTFLNDQNRCSIHEVKPYECRKAMACNFVHGVRYDLEQQYRDAGYPLGERRYGED